MKKYFDKAFTKIAVLGSGTMGGQIAAHFANLGFDTTMFDTSEEALSKSIAMMKKFVFWTIKEAISNLSTILI